VNYGVLAIVGVLYALGPLSLAHKQRRDYLLHEHIAGGVHLTMLLYGKGEGIGGGLFSQMSVHGRQEERDGLGSHDGRTKSGALYIYSRFIGQEGSL
jgi:hypothetical protein